VSSGAADRTSARAMCRSYGPADADRAAGKFIGEAFSRSAVAMEGARGPIRSFLLAMDQAMVDHAAAPAGEVEHGLAAGVAALQDQAAALARARSARERSLVLARFQLGVEEITRLIGQLLPMGRAPGSGQCGGHCTVRDALARVSSNFCDPRFHSDVTVKVVIDESVLENNIRLAPGNAATMISNLVDNALRRSPVGGKVLVCATALSDQLSIEVVDQGPAISEQALARIMDRLNQDACNTTSGLMGLFISQQLVELAGGTLALRNQSDCSGLIARIDLPRARL
jgi:signal transduction histidine kinase